MNSELEVLQRIVERERAARKAAEKILEEKSLELFKANEELKKLNTSLENRYQLIVEQANDIIYRGDENGHCIFVNQVVERILGYATEDLIGKHFSTLIVDEDSQRIKDFYLKQFKEKTENSYHEFRVQTKDGKIKWLGQNVNLILENGTIIGTSGVARDITEQKQAEEQVRRNEQKYQAIIENMELGLLEVDTEGIVVSANHRFTQMSGYDEEELIGKDPSFLLINEESRDLIRAKNKERESGKSSVYEINAFKKDGTSFWMMISGAPRFNKEGEFIGSIGIHMDVSKQKLLLNQLEEAKASAEESSIAKQKFLANMSHEIRTPLNAVLGMTYLLEETDTTKEQEEYLTTIKSSSELLLNIISDILDVAKIDSGKVEVVLKEFNLYDLLSAQCNSFKLLSAEKGVALKLDWNIQLEHYLIGDQKLVNQIFLNLIGNANKFTNQGEIQIIAEELNELGDEISIAFRIRDTGIGIEEAYLETIFESFEQANNSISSDYGGTGLGLSIAKYLIELLGGKIQVESAKGEGSTFSFSLRFKKGTKLKEAEVEINNSGLVLSLKGMSVLIAEDNPINQKFIGKLMEKLEIHFDMVNNGAECLEMLKRNKYDCLLLDMQMPILDGFEVCKQIRNTKSDYQNQVIIALTASALISEKEKALKAGVTELLTKPFNPKQLRSLLQRFYKNKEFESIGQIDKNVLHELYEGDDSFQLSMFDTFLNNINQEMDALITAAKGKDWKSIHQIAHKIKPTFKMVGLMQLMNCINDIEALSLKEELSTLAIIEKVAENISLAKMNIESERRKLIA